MGVKIRAVLYLYFFISLSAFSQNLPETYGIKAVDNPQKACGDYLEIYNSLPMDVRYGIELRDRKIIFYFPSERYFQALFDKNTDGIAIDIVHQDQYKCYAKNSFARSEIHRGFLLPPMYREEIMKRAVPNDQGYIWVEYGDLPAKFDPMDIECNLLVIQKKSRCGYHQFANLDYSNWGVLEMGLYSDSLSVDDYREVHGEISKNLRFVIPFEKNKSEFQASEIQPLYDSLNLTDYNVKEISIRAYTSVEGTLSRNIELQEQRARSIVDALQAYQSSEIKSSIVANENWVEFLGDVSGTSHENLIQLTKEEIKQKLEDKDFLEEMEPILKHHRKAYVELSLQKKFSSEENDPEILKKFFDQSIAEQDLNEAIYLQKIIFEKIRDNQLPEDFANQLEIPRESTYGPLLNNMAVFGHERNDLFLYDHIKNFESLLDILPENRKILYNLTALKIKAWREGELLTNREEILKNINELEKRGLEKGLVDRLQTNYYIILTQYYHQEQDYRAKYMAVYSKFDWAEAVLYDRMSDLDVDEDLLFYYINLTIHDPRNTQQSEYRKFLLNAMDKNEQRFCNLFSPSTSGGITFQLLDDDYLRVNYCENCYSSNLSN